MFSFIGLPPLIGFFGKQMVLTTALDNNKIILVNNNKYVFNI